MRYLKPRHNIDVCKWCKKFFFKRRSDAKTCSNACRKNLSVHGEPKGTKLVPLLVKTIIPPPRNKPKGKPSLLRKLWQDAEIQRTIREFEQELEANQSKKKAKKASQNDPKSRRTVSGGR